MSEASDHMVITLPIVLAERAQAVAQRTAAVDPCNWLAAEVAVELARFLVLPVE